MNALFGLHIQVSVGEVMIIALGVTILYQFFIVHMMDQICYAFALKVKNYFSACPPHAR